MLMRTTMLLPPLLLQLMMMATDHGRADELPTCQPVRLATIEN